MKFVSEMREFSVELDCVYVYIYMYVCIFICVGFGLYC